MKHISVFVGFLASIIVLASFVGIGIFMNWNSPDFKDSRTLIVSMYVSSVGVVLITMLYVASKKPFRKLARN